ncbi:MAG TPA: ribosome maturation factor RimM [Bacteroidales bacterium]|nr:ribosome maturation factor RimM [Bacteroidales bacterium]HQH19317.1 ribosome maturation factor RimM [Bacteroidales bacterium]
MKKEDCHLLGFLLKVHGFKGEVIFQLNQESPILISKLESVFIEINEQLIPFFIENTRPINQTSYILKFWDVDTIEQATHLLKNNVFILSSLLPKQKKATLQISDFTGFVVIDENFGTLGEIRNVIEMPQQLIFEIIYQNKEVLIPANEHIITKVDKKNRVVNIHAPEGLIDIYLGNDTNHIL